MTFVKHNVLQQNKLFLFVYYLGNRLRTNLEDTVPCYSLLHSQSISLKYTNINRAGLL